MPWARGSESTGTLEKNKVTTGARPAVYEKFSGFLCTDTE